MSDERVQEIIDKALESCSLDLRNIVGVITGLMGSGKTWLLNRLFNQIPPHLYNSTGVAEQSLRSMLHHTIDVSSDSWEPFTRSQILQLVACLFQQPQFNVELPPLSVEPVAATSATDTASSPSPRPSTPRSSPEPANSSTASPTKLSDIPAKSPEMPKSSTM
jgi:GTPase SAR1 family protein